MTPLEEIVFRDMCGNKFLVEWKTNFIKENFYQ